MKTATGNSATRIGDTNEVAVYDASNGEDVLSDACTRSVGAA